MRQVESERKFDIAEGEPLPTLEGIVGVGQAREHRMRAVYVDTVDLLLVRNRITLRRREGGSDAGWHLKLPRPDGTRLEVHAPLTDGPGRYAVPAPLLAEVAAVLGAAWPTGVEAALLPAATLTTDRAEIDLVDQEGRVVAQLCDDMASALPAGRTWRELEVELVGSDNGSDSDSDSDGGSGSDDDELLDRVTEAFEEQGVALADSPSKLARALGDRPERAAAGRGPRRKGPAGDVVLAYLSAQVGGIVGREADVRVDAPDAVHKARVATRRLRSALRTFRRLLDRDVTDPLRDEVRWLATALGGPRDAEVMKARILAALDALPQDQVVGPVRERVATELDRRHADAHQALVETLDSDRYRELLDRLVELLADPPWRGRARPSAAKALPDLVRAAVDRVAAEHAASAATTDEEERLHLLHETRKRAKAARYACEALAPSFGARATDAAVVWEGVTEALGGLQDSVVATTWLREIAEAAEVAGEPTFTYGRLVGAESAEGERSRAAGEEAVREALEHPWP
ncbi:CYTH and CHAD domain-containing protein [Ornithinimicrobium tianjinense]|uniref:CHAD domain-containing protein n=1 Tax=Ornithinimicrobium tianjinense TaxID=1195761 RepID=A0A917BC29_9MICO|nr:CYTH and CHAD domain-containing protein [Ornithinimicrobium tianjinense]GGF36793.1 CHAD domain-containing protein [Ornithinimicrobium tianjinense]